MIVSFSVSNFRSFLSEATFSLVASNRLAASHEEHVVSIPDSKEKVLRTAVLYGANGAGKSNLFKALRYVESVALRTRKKNAGTGRVAFRFGELTNEPSSFDLQFISDGKLYRLGFKVDDERVTEEWLVRVIGGKEKPIYERTTDNAGKVAIEAPGLEGDKLRALVTVGGPQNQSFLATVNATLDSSDVGEPLTGVLNWFKQTLNLVGPGEPYAPLGALLIDDPSFLEFASDFLKSSSTGVDHLEIVKKDITEEELRRLLPGNLVSRVLRDLDENKNRGAVFQLDDGDHLLVERRGENHFSRTTIQAAHKSRAEKIVPLELSEESDGTRRLLALIPVLHDLRTGSAVSFIDELDRSLHPTLAKKFLEFYLDSCPGCQRQLVVTTHESHLLDLDLLRRDEIWFAEKDQEGATHLYSLVDFKVRTDLEIRKHYLQGRFGAVPFLGDLDRLLHEKGQTG